MDSLRSGLVRYLMTTGLLTLGSTAVLGQTSVTLDGASGSETYVAGRTTEGGLTLGLSFQVEYLVVGGGGGGGSRHGGGGGAGGVLSGVVQAESSSYTIQVGAGGVGTSPHSGAEAPLVMPQSGQGSSVFGVTAAGGGSGGGNFAAAASGASGGGSASNTFSVGSGTVGQGFAGGAGISGNNDSLWAGGGGGGAAAAASNAFHDGSAYAGNGGTGLVSSITGSSVYYGGGGGGATGSGLGAGSGGLGGGGNGGKASSGVNATANTGGGGGAGGHFEGDNFAGGAGGSGVVIVRYKGGSAGTGGAVAAGTGSASGYTLHTFTATGSNALNLSSLELSTRLGAVENGVIAGSGDLTFTGPGTLTLNATNTYSGTTRVNAGTLALGSGGSIGNSAGVSVASGARFNVSTVSGGFNLGATQTLSGGGTIAGNTTISGTHSPGFSPGIQTFEDDLTYTVGSNLIWELIDNTIADRGTNYDGVDVGGNLSFSGATTITLDFDLAGSAVDWSNGLWSSDITGTAGWKIYDVTGTISGFENLTLSSINWLDGQGDAFTSVRPDASFSLFQGTDGIYLNYSAVPEPSAALLGGLGMLALLRRRR